VHNDRLSTAARPTEHCSTLLKDRLRPTEHLKDRLSTAAHFCNKKRNLNFRREVTIATSTTIQP